MEVRRTESEIIIAGKNVTEYISKYLKSISFNDVMEGESDTAQITLHDSDRLFIGDWFPTRGDTANITLIKKNWNSPVETLNLKDFEIDEITNSISSSGSTANIKLNSIANKSELRSMDKSRAWENVKLSKIAKDIADEAGVELFYDTNIDPEIKRAEQKEKSNLGFLYGLCKKNYLALRMSDSQLIIFDAEKYEQQEPCKTIKCDGGEVISFNGSATISKIYKSCRVKYQHGKNSEKYDYTYSDDSKESGMTLEVNEKVESQADAERLAKNKLKDKNRDEIKVRMKVLGDFIYNAGLTVQLEGFGFYDGKFMIKKVVHNVGNGYTCDLDLYKVT